MKMEAWDSCPYRRDSARTFKPLFPLFDFTDTWSASYEEPCTESVGVIILDLSASITVRDKSLVVSKPVCDVLL